MTDSPSAMTSRRPYLLRALYEWISDNQMTPHLLVDARVQGVRVPPHTVSEGRVVLNIADRAVSRLDMDNAAISFSARFGGVSHSVHVPIDAVIAVYARESGQGMVLPDDLPVAEDAEASTKAPEAGESSEAQGLSVVAAADAHAQGDADTHADADGQDDNDQDPSPSPPRRGAHLRVVK